jgi:hypothetical protein
MADLSELYAEQDAHWNQPDETFDDFVARRRNESRHVFSTAMTAPAERSNISRSNGAAAVAADSVPRPDLEPRSLLDSVESPRRR